VTTYTGTLGNDTLTANNGAGVMTGLDGDDVLIANSIGKYTLDGGAGDDQLYGTVLADSVSGGAGNDILGGGGGADILSGGPGADVFAWSVGVTGLSAGTLNLAHIIDWSPDDRIAFAAGAMSGQGYLELDASDPLFDRQAAANAIANGSANIVVLATGGDLIVYADSKGDNGVADDAVYIDGRTLADIDINNFIATSKGDALPLPPSRVLPAGASGSVDQNMDGFHVGSLQGAEILAPSATNLLLQGDHVSLSLSGTGFSYDANGQLVSGSVTNLIFSSPGFFAHLTTPGLSAAPFLNWVVTDASQDALTTILAGNDNLQGGNGADLIRGFDGADVIAGGDGANTIFGGLGDDVIYGDSTPSATALAPGANYLRGDDGNDYIVGASNFDDINGNMGNDTASGGGGDDWVVGGKDNDLLFGDAGSDLVYGNLGADTIDGGAGNDIVRGGQGDDVATGGDGADFLSGDLGNDTITGGAGADIFHTFGTAGLDRVTDFNLSEGDRVMVDPGTVYTVSQSGADTVINMTGGGQMVLVGVQMASLTGAWIFGA
jgi:Ca2+-binding RTX toxin-like protein